MKSRRVALSLLAALLAGPAMAGFTDVLDSPAQISPLASSTLTLAVTRAGNRLVAVGARGHILLSDDNGAHWHQAEVPVSSDLTAVSFPTPLTGWAVGHDGVVLSSGDGGEHWSKQMDGRDAARSMVENYQGELLEEARRLERDGPDKPFLDVWFADAKTGYVVGAYNLIFKTVDAGAHWTPLYDRTENPQRFHLYAIRPCGPDLCIAGESGLMLRARKGSDQFKAQPFPYKGSLFGLAVTSDAVLAFGLRGNLFRSADGGASWTRIEVGERSALVGAIAEPAGKVTLVAQSGAVYVSGDDGQNFTPLPLARPLPLCAVAQAADGALVLAGFAGLQRGEVR